MRRDTTAAFFVFLFSASLAACIPTPSRIERPDVAIGPWEQKTVASSSGHEYEYLHIAGPAPGAPVLLLLHGGTVDNRIWLYTDELAEHFELYAPLWPDNSLMYSGRSSDYAAVAHDFLQAIGVDEVYIAAVSMGTYPAIDLASVYDDVDVKALVLISTVMFGVSEEEVEGRVGVGQRALSFSPDKLRGIVQWTFERKDFGDAPGDVKMEDFFFIRPYPYYYQVFSMMVNQGDARQATERVTCPVLVLHGEEDDIMPVDAARMTLSVFPNAKPQEFRAYAGQGHSVVFFHGPQIAKEMMAFFERAQAL